jgi:DNA-binding GntR family transcriptional regulator
VYEKDREFRFKSLTECVKDYLKARLVDGELKPGEEINLPDLCETLGVSRTPVREALIQLVMYGFIEEPTRKKFRVKRMSPNEIKDFYEIGGILESEIIISACDSITDADIRKLEEILKQIDQALDDNDPETYLEKNDVFNSLLWDFCGNKVLKDSLTSVRERLYFAKKRLDFPKWNKMLVADHREMIGYLREKNRPGLRTLLREQHWNFSRAYPFLCKLYNFSDPDDSRNKPVVKDIHHHSQVRRGGVR